MQISKRAIANVFYTSILGVCSMNLDAAPITGVVNLSATVGVSATTIDFRSDPSQGCGAVVSPGFPGCFTINSPVSGSFVAPAIPFGFNALNSIKDLTGGPIVGFTTLTAFMQFTNGVTFDLTRIVPGGSPTCDILQGNNPNYVCTPLNSPFTLLNSSTGQNATVAFNVEVSGYTGALNTGSTPYLGAFSTQGAGANIASLLNTIGTGGTVVASYSANFSPVPEPGTLGTLGLGLGMLVFGAYRRSSRSAR